MNLLTLNTGSSSVRLAAFGRGADGALARLADGHYASGRHGPEELLRRFLDEHALSGMDVAAHRVCMAANGCSAHARSMPPLRPRSSG